MKTFELRLLGDTLYIVGRYDILPSAHIFDNLRVDIDEIIIGSRTDDIYFKGIASSDILYAFQPCNIDKICMIQDYYNKRVSQFSFAEEPFTDLIYNSFVQINKWKYDVDFNIQTEI